MDSFARLESVSGISSLLSCFLLGFDVVAVLELREASMSEHWLVCDFLAFLGKGGGGMT